MRRGSGSTEALEYPKLYTETKRRLATWPKQAPPLICFELESTGTEYMNLNFDTKFGFDYWNLHRRRSP